MCSWRQNAASGTESEASRNTIESNLDHCCGRRLAGHASLLSGNIAAEAATAPYLRNGSSVQSIKRGMVRLQSEFWYSRRRIYAGLEEELALVCAS
jgi:hypothetical protein